MWNIDDYKNFVSFLEQDGIDIGEYKKEFSEIVDKLNDIYYHIDSNKNRFKFSETYNVFGFSVIGLTVMHSLKSSYSDVKLALADSDSDLGFRVHEIPFDKGFVDLLHEIFVKEININN